MSAPGSAQPRPSLFSRPQAKITTAAIILTLVTAGCYFLPTRSFETEFLWGVRPVSFQTILFPAGVSQVGWLGTTDIGDAGSAMRPWFLIFFLVLAVAAIVMLARRTAPRAAGAMLAVAGLLTAGIALIQTGAGAEGLVGIPADVSEQAKFLDRAIQNGTLTTSPSAYMIVIVGLALIGVGIYAIVRPVGRDIAAAPATAPTPYYPQPPYPQAPPVYNPAAHQQPFPTQPPTWPGNPQTGQPLPPQYLNAPYPQQEGH